MVHDILQLDTDTPTITPIDAIRTQSGLVRWNRKRFGCSAECVRDYLSGESWQPLWISSLKTQPSSHCLATLKLLRLFIGLG